MRKKILSVMLSITMMAGLVACGGGSQAPTTAAASGTTAAEAAAEGVTMTQHALRWALAQPGVVSALVGVKREEQIDEAAGAVR